MRISFRTQTVFAILAISLLIGSGLIFLTLQWSRQVETAFLKKQEQILLRQIHTLATSALRNGDDDALRDVVRRVASDTSVSFLRLSDMEGNPLAQVGAEEDFARLADAPREFTDLRGHTYVSRIELTSEGHPVAIVDLGLSASASEGLLEEMRMMGLGLLFPVLGIMAAFSWLFGSLLTERLRALTVVADRIAEKGPGLTIRVRGDDEIARVSRSLNHMSENLAVTYRQLRDSAREQRELSDRLAEKEKLQRTMLETALDAVITVDADGLVVDFNRTAEQIFGYRREEALGQEMAPLIIPKQFREAHRKGMDHFHLTGEGPVLGQRLEMEGMRKNGEVFPIELAIVDVDVDGRHLFTGFIRDITERRKAESELRLAASAFETREGIFITDIDSNIIRVNRAFEQMTGYSRKEAATVNPADLIAPNPGEDSPRIGWNDLLARGQDSAEVFVRRQGGETFPVWLGLTPVSDNEGKLTHHVAHFFDMTDRIRFEQELRDAHEEAEAASEAKSRFLANMSHEIRTPLNAIINLNELLLETGLTDEQKKLAETAKQGGKALSSLVSGVLDLTQIESGKLSINAHVFNLRRMIMELDALFSPQANSSGIDLKTTLADTVPEWVEGDEMRLRQVLINLLGNALKFTEKGWVALTVSCPEGCDGQCQTCMEAIQFRVDDTGIGIPEEATENIFEEFTQADVSLARRYGGSGLGLSISQLLVRMMHGQIEYRPRAGGGSTFSFAVPLPAAQHEDSPVEDERREPARVGGRVLLAEDSLANQMVARAILEKAGCTVFIANNGREAVEMVTESVFDLVFMDLSMPEVDGLEATRQIRALETANASVPIIAMTANVFEEDRQRCFEVGMNDFVGKPIEASQLRAKLQEWLSSEEGPGEPADSATDSDADTPLLDRAVLADMERETSADLLTEIVGIFVSESQSRLIALEESAALPLTDITSAAHAIKSSAGTFGARRLQEAARRTEEAARNGREEARSLIRPVVQVGEKTMEAYLRFLAERGVSVEDTGVST